jgi:hypothetical protein
VLGHESLGRVVNPGPTGGRIMRHLRHNVHRPETAVMIVGFQSPGTLGRQLVDGAKSVCIFGERVVVHASIPASRSGPTVTASCCRPDMLLRILIEGDVGGKITPHLSGLCGFFRAVRTFGWLALELQSDCWRQSLLYSYTVTGNSTRWTSCYPSSIWAQPTMQSYGDGSGAAAESMC